MPYKVGVFFQEVVQILRLLQSLHHRIRFLAIRILEALKDSSEELAPIVQQVNKEER